MIDPATTTTWLLAGASAARNVFSGKADEKEVQQLAVRYWGHVLYELRRNIVGIKSMAAATTRNSYPHLRLRAWDELFGTLCKLTPMPGLMSTIQELNDGIEEVAFLLRTALGATTNAEGVHDRPGGHQWDNAFGQAHDIAAQNPEACFNQIRDVIAGAGRTAFGDKAWQMQEPEMLPSPL